MYLYQQAGAQHTFVLIYLDSYSSFMRMYIQKHHSQVKNMFTSVKCFYHNCKKVQKNHIFFMDNVILARIHDLDH